MSWSIHKMEQSKKNQDILGIEPGTSQSAVECSTTELDPLEAVFKHNRIDFCQPNFTTKMKTRNKAVKTIRGHLGFNQGPLDMQSNALPLSYIPFSKYSSTTGLTLANQTSPPR